MLKTSSVVPSPDRQKARIAHGGLMPHASEPVPSRLWPAAKLCPPVDVRAIANWSNEQRHSRMCAPDGFHRLDRACIGSQLPKLPSLQSIGLMITGLAPLTADTSYQARFEIAAGLTT